MYKYVDSLSFSLYMLSSASLSLYIDVGVSESVYIHIHADSESMCTCQLCVCGECPLSLCVCVCVDPCALIMFVCDPLRFGMCVSQRTCFQVTDFDCLVCVRQGYLIISENSDHSFNNSITPI